jgi:hypothetical protein
MTQGVPGQRRERRYAVDVDATLTLESGHRLKARTRDLSRTGICLIAGEAVASGAGAAVQLILSFGNNAFSEPLELSARIVWCTQLSDSFQLGAMFEELSEQQDQFVDVFLQYLDGPLSPQGIGDEEDPYADPGHPDDEEGR